MEFEPKLLRLALQLSKRRKYVLVLGSNVMPVAAIEDHVLERGLGLDAAERAKLTAFQRYKEFNQAWDELRRADEAELLDCFADAFAAESERAAGNGAGNGYAALAQLIKREYFELILTADVSHRLEDALGRAAVGKDKYRILANRRWDVNEIRKKLDEGSGRAVRTNIVRVYGDIDDRFAFGRAELDEFTQALQPVLEDHLKQPVIVVGHHAERDLWPFSEDGGTFYYVSTPGVPQASPVFRAVRARGGEACELSGAEADFDAFFTRLGRELVGGAGSEPQEVPLERLQHVGIDATEQDVEQLRFRERERARAGAEPQTDRPLVELLSEGSPEQPPELIEEVKRNVLTITYDKGQQLSFKVEGQLSYQSERAVPLSMNVETLNRALQFMGRDIHTYYKDGDLEGHAYWRERAREKGEELYRQLFSDHELQTQFGKVTQAGGDDENLVLCFAGPRQHLGMPYELLYERGPLAVRHPVCRQVTGVTGRDETFADLLTALKRRKEPLRVLLLASNTGGIDVDQEVRELAESIGDKVGNLKIKSEIKTILTDDLTHKLAEKYLERCKYHIVHFAGHGSFKPTAEDSCLEVWRQPKRRGGVECLTARHLNAYLRGSETRLFYLSSCVGATVGGPHLLSQKDYLGVMDGLVQAGVPIVFGYRWYVTDTGARQFAATFYRSLMETRCPTRAALRARKEIYVNNPTDETWTSPILVVQKI